VDGKQIAQSLAIGRFLANRFNLSGADEFERAKGDEILEALREFGNGTFHTLNCMVSLE